MDYIGRVYASYAEALQECGSGYEEMELVKVVVEKNVIFQSQHSGQHVGRFDLSSLRTLIGLSLIRKEEINVVDLGGGGGYHYFIAQAAVGEEVKLRWNVVETPAMAHEAKSLENDKLKFFDNVMDAAKDLGRVDLAFCSGALCYVPRPYEILRQLTSIGAQYFFITRTPLTRAETEPVIVQTSRLGENGPGELPEGVRDCIVKYPVVFPKQSEVERIIGEKYLIKFLLEEEKAAYRVGLQAIDMFGYFCVLKERR